MDPLVSIVEAVKGSESAGVVGLLMFIAASATMFGLRMAAKVNEAREDEIKRIRSDAEQRIARETERARQDAEALALGRETAEQLKRVADAMKEQAESGSDRDDVLDQINADFKLLRTAFLDYITGGKDSRGDRG